MDRVEFNRPSTIRKRPSHPPDASADGVKSKVSTALGHARHRDSSHKTHRDRSGQSAGFA
jgi:hypothetical protein